MSAQSCGCDWEAGWVCDRHCGKGMDVSAQYTGPIPPDVVIQTFETGATRNLDSDKFDYEGFLNPDVLHAFATYMHGHRRQKDGSLRASDNWQKGIPRTIYMKSLIRHSIDLWRWHRGYKAINPDTGEPHTGVDLCCAVMFNIMGLLKELLHPAGEGL